MSQARAATRLQEKSGGFETLGEENTRAGCTTEFTKFKLVTVILEEWGEGSMPGVESNYSYGFLKHVPDQAGVSEPPDCNVFLHHHGAAHL